MACSHISLYAWTREIRVCKHVSVVLILQKDRHPFKKGSLWQRAHSKWPCSKIVMLLDTRISHRKIWAEVYLKGLQQKYPSESLPLITFGTSQIVKCITIFSVAYLCDRIINELCLYLCTSSSRRRWAAFITELQGPSCQMKFEAQPRRDIHYDKKENPFNP